MSNPIDLCTLGQCRLWLGIASGQGGNSAETMVVATTIPAGVPSSGMQTVTPASLAMIQVNMVLGIDVGTPIEEYVAVVAVSSTTFNAYFQYAHAANATVIDTTDSIIGRLITSVSTGILWFTGRMNGDGSIPTQSSLNTQVSYNEWYDGNGNNRLFLRQSPIASVQAAFVNGVSVPQSTVSTSGSIIPGWVVDQNGRCLVLRTNGYYGGRFGYNSYLMGGSYSPVWAWVNGTQNINIQYTAGYVMTPYDINDIATRLVGLAYRRRAWIGLKSNAQPQGAGTLNYDLSDMTEDDKRVLFNYKRIAQAA